MAGMPVILCIITVLDLYGWNACDPLIITVLDLYGWNACDPLYNYCP